MSITSASRSSATPIPAPESAARGARVGVVDEDVDEPLALAGQRAHPEQVDAGVTGRLPEPGELAGAVREDHREVGGHRAHSNLNPNEQPPRGRDQPVPAPARGEPGRLASVGPEALERATELDRPVLLSIGYSSCHWCHVMEHESFEDPETARFMNEHFVPVKVDREERRTSTRSTWRPCRG